MRRAAKKADEAQAATLPSPPRGVRRSSSSRPRRRRNVSRERSLSRTRYVRRPFARRFDSRLGRRVRDARFFSRPVRGRLRRLCRRRSMIPHTHRPDHNMWANEIDYNSMRPRRFCFGARTSRSARFSSRSVPRDAHHYLHSLRMTMITTTHRHFYVTERPGARRADSNRPARPVVLPGPDPRRAVTITFFHMLDFADLLDGVDVTDKRPSDARFRNPERTTTPDDFFLVSVSVFVFVFVSRDWARNRTAKPNLLV